MFTLSENSTKLNKKPNYLAFTIIYFAIVSLVVFLDQLTKYLAIEYLKPIPTFPIINGVIHFTYVENKGAAFGMFSNNRWVFMVISVVAILGILIYSMIEMKKLSPLTFFSFALIVGGGIGNMIDRTISGFVVDFIDFRLINFAVFNVADSFVTIGAFALLVLIIFVEFKNGKKT